MNRQKAGGQSADKLSMRCVSLGKHRNAERWENNGQFNLNSSRCTVMTRCRDRTGIKPFCMTENNEHGGLLDITNVEKKRAAQQLCWCHIQNAERAWHTHAVQDNTEWHTLCCILVQVDYLFFNKIQSSNPSHRSDLIGTVAISAAAAVLNYIWLISSASLFKTISIGLQGLFCWTYGHPGETSTSASSCRLQVKAEYFCFICIVINYLWHLVMERESTRSLQYCDSFCIWPLRN